MNTKENKWLLVSCLQKSIRQGLENLSFYYLTELNKIDPNYLYHRLIKLAIEDLGVSDLTIIKELIDLHFLKENHLDKLQIAKNIISKCCSAPKDRSIADLVLLSSYYENENQPIETLSTILLDKKSPVVDRFNAGKTLFHKHTTTHNNQILLTNLKAINQHNPNKPILEQILETSFSNKLHEDGLIALTILFDLFHTEKKNNLKVGDIVAGTVTEDFLIQKKLINNKWLLDGIDWHTKEGRTAIQEFALTNNPITNILLEHSIEQDSIPEIIGLLLFRTRGIQLNKKLIYPSSFVISKLLEHVIFKNVTKNSNLTFEAASKILANNLNILDNIIQQKINEPDPTTFPF